MKFFSFDESYQRARLVSFFTDACSLCYHILVFLIFYKLKVFTMFYYNIVSITVFTTLLLLINRVKTYEVLYFIALVEVIVHQVLADYFLGTDACFHYFILLMGLLPFFIFQNKGKVIIPVTTFADIVFIILNNTDFTCKYPVSNGMIVFLKNLNTSITIIVIAIMVLVFTRLVYRTEKNLESQNKKLESEITMAAVIQQSFFKQNVSGISDYQLGFYNKPMSGVSGDIYDFYSTDNKLDGVGFFDVSGHGISSGLVTMLVKNIIHQEFYNNEDLELWEIMNRINDRVISEKGDIENYLTGILLRVKNEKIEMVSAGHPRPIIYHAETGECEYLQNKDKSVGAIGIPGFPVYFYSEYINFNKGDEIILYSDGVCDVENSMNQKFGPERFLKTVEKSILKPVEEQIEEIGKTIRQYHSGIAQNDDITYVILKRVE